MEELNAMDVNAKSKTGKQVSGIAMTVVMIIIEIVNEKVKRKNYKNCL